MSDTSVQKKSPNLDLRGEIGHYVVGVFKKRFESKNYPGKFSSLIEVHDTTGSTTLWNGEKEAEVSINSGDTIFLSESSWIAKFTEKLKGGEKIRIEYTGKAKPTKKGYKAAYTYKLEVL